MSEEKPKYHFADMRDKLLYDALVQYQKACQEQARALGMMIAAMQMKSENKKETEHFIAMGIIETDEK